MTQEEFKQRRQRLLAQIEKGSVVIISAAPAQLRNGDTEYPYRPDSDFYYLTGFHEPEAIAVLIPGRSEGEYILFNRPLNSEQAIWEGHYVGQENACLHYGVDQAFAITEFMSRLPDLLIGCERIYTVLGRYPSFDQKLSTLLSILRSRSRHQPNPFDHMINLEWLLHEMRLIKSSAEINCLRKAAQVSAQAHCRAMQACRPMMREYQLEAVLQFEFVRNGCTGNAYPTIVGGGSHGCILHYVENRAELHDGELVLIDAGGEYEYYAADITRTFPVNGHFTPEQKAIYEIVLSAQLAGIAQVKPGNTWDMMQTTIVECLTQGLCDLGILSGDLHDLIRNKAYARFYMHNSGHWLGLDVHDPSVYKIDNIWRPLQPGMVLTVEPGLYIAAHHADIDEKWHDIGIRIEDDILVTETGCEVLSADAPKTIAEIEALMRGSSASR